MTFTTAIFTNCWKFLITLGAPVLLILIPMYCDGPTGKEPYAAFTIILMAIYWCTECVPLPVTAFIPVILYPLFGILTTDKVTSAYFSDSIMFLFGGCVLALSFEYTNLHTRIALKVIMLVGARISQLMLGIMMTTMFLSMWMNNTSTTAMMVPIVDAIMEELKKKMLEANAENLKDNQDLQVKRKSIQKSKEISERKFEKINKKIRDLKIMFLLATAYSSNIGGTGVITGSGTNVIVLDIVRKDADEELASEACKKFLEISFLDWMIFNVPPMIINTIICWIYLQIHFLGIPKFLKFWGKKSKDADAEDAMTRSFEDSVESAMKQQYNELGSIRFNEIGVLILFCIMVFLWVFKDPQFIPGWDALPIFGRSATGKSLIKECTPTLLICFLMFAIPGKAIYYKNLFSGGLEAGMKDPLLSFDFILKKFPWGIFLLLGGGSSMALGAKESGLNKWVEHYLENNETLQTLPGPIILLIVLFFIATLTSVASNTATAAIVTPVLLGMAYVKNMHPLYMVYAASTACSYAFVLPVSTPPNAIVYSSSDLKLAEMMKPGFLINVICLGVLFVTTHTTSWWIFNFGGYNGECSSMALLGSADPH